MKQRTSQPNLIGYERFLEQEAARRAQIKSDLYDNGTLFDNLSDLIKNNPKVQTVALVGPPGVGKTSLASQLAHRLQRAFLSNDPLVTAVTSGVIWNFARTDEYKAEVTDRLIVDRPVILDGYSKVAHMVLELTMDRTTYVARVKARNAAHSLSHRDELHIQKFDDYRNKWDVNRHLAWLKIDTTHVFFPYMDLKRNEVINSSSQQTHNNPNSMK